MRDFLTTVARLVRADFTKLTHYWVALAGFVAIGGASAVGAVAMGFLLRAAGFPASSGYDFAINLMVRAVDVTAPILYVMLCILFSIDVANSTVKYILTRPVSRMELLVSKYVTAALMVTLAVGLMWGAALGMGAWLYDFGALRENEYVIFEASYAWRQIAVGTLFLLIGYASLASMALMVSVFSSTMGGAIIIGMILYMIVGSIALVPEGVVAPLPILGGDRSIPISSLAFPAQLFVPIARLDDLAMGLPIERWWTWEMQRFTGVSLLFAAVFFGIAAWGVRRRDFVL